MSNMRGTPRPPEPPVTWRESDMTLDEYTLATNRWVRWHNENPHPFSMCECCERCVNCQHVDIHPIHRLPVPAIFQ